MTLSNGLFYYFENNKYMRCIPFLVILFLACTNSRIEKNYSASIYFGHRLLASPSMLKANYFPQKKIIEKLEDYINEPRPFDPNTIKTYWHSSVLEKFEVPGLGMLGFLNDRALLDNMRIMQLAIQEIDYNHYKEQGYFFSKTMFAETDDNGLDYPRYIIDMYIHYDKGTVKFVDPLLKNLEEMGSYTEDSITFYFPEDIKRDTVSIQKTLAFNQKMADFFATEAKRFSVVVQHSLKDIRKINGLDYSYDMYFDNQYGGESHAVNNIIFSGNGSSFYPHEIVHLYTERYKPHSIYNEGFATFFGGTRGYTLEEQLSALKELIGRNPKLNLSSIEYLNQYVNDIHLKYVVGGLLVKIALQEMGKSKTLELLYFEPDAGGFYQSLQQVFGISKENMNEYLHQKIKQYG